MIFSENRYTPIGSEPEGKLFRIMLQSAAEHDPCESRSSREAGPESEPPLRAA
jgi:hypothetical protein